MEEHFRKEKKERYLFISCAGSGYQEEIVEFLKNTYINKGEYYDHLQVAGSIYSLLWNGKNFVYNAEEYNFFIMRDNLLVSIEYLAKKHNLTKIVVVSEPDCALYKDMSNFKYNAADKFSSQKKAFYITLEILDAFLIANLSIDNLEGWHMFLNSDGAIMFEQIFNKEYKVYYK